MTLLQISFLMLFEFFFPLPKCLYSHNIDIFTGNIRDEFYTSRILLFALAMSCVFTQNRAILEYSQNIAVFLSKILRLFFSKHPFTLKRVLATMFYCGVTYSIPFRCHFQAIEKEPTHLLPI